MTAADYDAEYEQPSCTRCGSPKLRSHSNVFGSPIVIREASAGRGAVVSVYCVDCGNEQTAQNDGSGPDAALTEGGRT